MAKLNGGIKECSVHGIGRVMYVKKDGTQENPQLKIMVSCTLNRRPLEGEQYSPKQTFGVTLFGKSALNASKYNLLVKGNVISFTGDLGGIYISEGKDPILNLESYTFTYSVVAYADEEAEEAQEDAVEAQLEEPPAKKSKRTEDLDLG